MLNQSSLNYLSFVNRVYELLIVANDVMRDESEADRAAISTLTAALQSYIALQQKDTITIAESPAACAKIMQAFAIIFGSYFCQITYYKMTGGFYQKSENAPNCKIYTLTDFLWDDMRITYEEIFKDHIDSSFTNLCKEVNIRKGF